MNFIDFALKVHAAKGVNFDPPKRLISLDPGETTGLAIFENGKLVQQDQLNTKTIPIGVQTLNRILDGEETMVVFEDYRVYGHKTESHAWAGLHTPQLIGVIRTFCTLRDMPTFTQMATFAKGFATDPKLKEWGMYSVGQKHARDAVRHGTYYMLFNQGKILDHNNSLEVK